MYEAIKTVIESGRYELKDILRKIDILWMQGDIDDAQRAALAKLAREKATPEMGYASLEAQVAELRSRVEALENAAGGNGSGDEDYPAWKQPVGAHDAYYTGMRMTYTDGKHYVCIAPKGYAVTYGPDVLPAYWEGE